MKSRIITLFGEEEIVPEDLQAVPKPVAAKANGKATEAIEVKGAALLADWQPQKQYYAIGEVAVLFGLRTSHIRSWTIEFELKVRTTKKGDRLYNPANIGMLRSIYHLVKERGFTLAGAKAWLQQGDKTEIEGIDLKQSLLKLRNQLLIIRNKLV